ncbi:MAG: AI-2E family transporter [Rhodospirillales bacterium]|nr:AI-2E family transporter [Rhodospirillales bacterium]
MNDSDAGVGNQSQSDAEPMRADWRLRRINITLWAAIGITLALLLLSWAGPTIILIFAGILAGTVLHGAGSWLSRRMGIPSTWSLAIICAGVVVVIGLAGWWIGPHVGDQLTQLEEQLRSSWDSIRQRLEQSFLSSVMSGLTPSSIADQLGAAAGGLMSAAGAALSVVGGLVVIAFIGLYTALAPSGYTAGLLWITPPARRDQVGDLLGAVAATLRWWFFARMMSMATVGVLTGLGLWLIGMPLFIALGIVAALCSFVPYLGPIVSAIPALLIGLAQSPTMGLYVLALYVAVQTAESYVITPQFVQRAISFPPAAVLIVQLLFGVFFGILGVAFASPISAAILTVMKKTFPDGPASRMSV